ncbi:LOW QUALITY PROTEIN: protein LMBR1L [Pezoporus flaviventris]|uniref:LOW QUALITY PROTEIN: protein LMBR1L n=1 Tax=Pezoporus flaviventris TaxID=889875 RepID=UPI002AB29235|nr:LOW QUALITY PROTEIN: protein LMBR1L [Pezoporus flaviventris]
MASTEQDALALREQLFHERVRECIICTLLFTSLYILCHFIITHFKKHTDFAAEHDDEDAAVNRIALGLCTFTLAVALGAVLLLPFSIISNEVLLSFPRNYYIQWLNGSLVHGLWNLVFLFSNLSLVFLMPFAYFFTESEGFAGSKKGIMARVYETSVVLLLLTLLVLGMVWVASAIMGNNAASRQSLYDLWEYYLPYLYSCISLFGVLLLLLCTPFGLSTMFTVMGQLLVKPWLLEDLDEQLSCTRLEEATVSRRICSGKASCWLNLNIELLQEQLFTIRSKRRKLELQHQASPWQRNLGYPLAMLGLLALTGTSVLIVCFHVLELMLDDAAMPRGIQDTSLGRVSFSIFGSFGAALQVILILYLMVSSVVGFYSSPLFTRLLPVRQDTPLTKIIGNCVSLLVLSSALPVFSRTLGITRFDLLGDFGRFNWLGNFYIVFLYNMGFAALTTLCLVKRVSWAVQAELIHAFGLHKLPLPMPCSRRLTQPC